MMDTQDYGVWQPIETAPKDGTSILLAHEHPNNGWVMAAARHFAGRWYANGGSVVWLSTHWMPLPSPPGEVK
jgi:hypothetical protein